MSTPPVFMTDDDVLMATPTGSPRRPLSWRDLDLQTAVAVSMDELDNLGRGDGPEGIGESPPNNQTCPGASPTTRPNAGDLQPGFQARKALKEHLGQYQEAAQYALEKRIELPLLNFADADTLVIIDPPPMTRRGDEEAGGCGWVPVDSAPHRMHSDRLKATDSPYFMDALGPTKQFRLVRRRRLSPLPPGIKFVIDLTPPEEGDIAVELTTELSCSKGVRQYFRAEQLFEVQASLVGGHDDLEEKNIIENARNPFFPIQEEGSPMPMDYTAIRHRSAIERVLHIIEGLDPRIDSAPKMWSVFCVAKFLSCTSEVENYILSWIYDGRNVRFIETLPEVTLKIAEGLRNHMLCRDAFSILVGEEALASVGKDISGGFWRSRARRRREELDLDSFVTRVEYASKAFAERVNATFAELAEAKWITEVAEYQKITSFLKTRLGSDCRAIGALTARLRSFIRTRIFHALSALPPLVEGLDRSDLPENRNGRALFPYSSHADVYGGINHKEALLLQSYWRQLEDARLLAQTFTPHTDPVVWVRGVEDSFQKTTWSEVLRETEEFNWSVIEMINEKNFIEKNTSLHTTGPVGGPKDTLGSRTGPPGVPLPRAPGSESSVEAGTGSTNCLPIRPKHAQRGSALELPGAENTKDLPIWPRSWLQGLTPSTLLDIGPPRRLLRSGELAEGAVEPRDIAIAQQRHDSDQISNAANTLLELETPLFTSQKEASECVNVVGAEGIAVDLPEGLRDLKKLGGTIQLEAAEVESNLNGITNHVDYESRAESSRGSRFQYNPFNIHFFLSECSYHIHAVARKMTKGSVSFDTLITDTLLSLDENEWKYLPLYAGGNDDGSGGVFDQPIPNAVTGPIGPGPRYHIGQGSAASSEFDMIDAKSAVSSSFHTSMGVEDGYSDHLDRRNVYSDDEMGERDVKGKGKAREVDEGDGEEYEDAAVVEGDSDGDDDENFCEVEDDLMLFA